MKTQEDDDWRCDVCTKHLQITAELLSLSRGIKPPKTEQLAEIMAMIESDSENEIFKVFEEEKEKTQELVKDLTYSETDRIVYIFRILHLALNAGKYKEKVEKILGS